MQSHQWQSVVLSPGPHWGPWRGIHPEFRVNGVHCMRKEEKEFISLWALCLYIPWQQHCCIRLGQSDKSNHRLTALKECWHQFSKTFACLPLTASLGEGKSARDYPHHLWSYRSTEKLRRRQMKQKAKRKVLREEKGREKEGKWRSGRKRGRKAEERVEKRKEGEERKRREEMGGKTSIRVFMYW